jgi:hypothetical protein
LELVLNSSPRHYRIIGNRGMMAGMITEQKDGRWRVELFMRIDAYASTEAEAVAFAQGCFATCEAFNVRKGVTSPGQMPTVKSKE